MRRALDETRVLESVEVPCQGRALDADRLCELLLRPTPLALQLEEDQPRRQRPSRFGEGGCEGATDRPAGLTQLASDRLHRVVGY